MSDFEKKILVELESNRELTLYLPHTVEELQEDRRAFRVVAVRVPVTITPVEFVT